MAAMKLTNRKLLLRLYVAGSAPNSVCAIANARTILKEHYGTRHVLEIVDLLEEPHRALADSIIVTPTLLKLSPLPTVRVIGTLNNAIQVLRALGTT